MRRGFVSGNGLECPGSAQGALCPSEVAFCLSNPNSETIAQLSLRATHAGRAGKAGLSRLYSLLSRAAGAVDKLTTGCRGGLAGWWPLWPFPAVGQVVFAGCRNSIPSRTMNWTAMEKEIFLDVGSFGKFQSHKSVGPCATLDYRFVPLGI